MEPINPPPQGDGNPVEVVIVYPTSGRRLRMVCPATPKLFAWVDEMAACEDVFVSIGPVSGDSFAPLQTRTETHLPERTPPDGRGPAPNDPQDEHDTH